MTNDPTFVRTVGPAAAAIHLTRWALAAPELSVFLLISVLPRT
jgi:hypothetical protein